ncbi:MAG: citrate synthase [Chitinophagales bacterium]|nr:citrate synthase [Chitinophagales bacterium]MCO5281471.1 citrate synthase [Chitinophagales bacterium]OJV27728.1 MAG: citrate (Si)-synthase [Bacteroidetes bacterium 37-13]HRN93426.1 citrate synthase [Chitinophagales bacterium]HRP38514.1 citrate synthase [Chitinophagales bacterium]
MAETATLSYGGKSYELPIITGTENESAIDISKLRSDSGLITFDEGYKNTGSTISNITFLDGEKGILHYRGYTIEDLASKASFVEVIYLLLYGELPTQTQLSEFEGSISKHTLVHENLVKVFEVFPTGSHPMGQLMTMMSALSSFYPDSLNPNKKPEETNLTVIRLLAKMTTMCAMIHKKGKGHPVLYPQNKYDYVTNFLYMTFGNVSEEYIADPVIVDAMNKLLILHADHEQNCSASTVRIVGSSHANLYASIAAGIAALWGPRHGGANQEVLEMLEDIRTNAGGDVKRAVAEAKDKKRLLFGFGHRVYKNFDPRAKIIKVACDNILAKLGVNDPLLAIAKELEEVALNDPYFVERKLYPNVDFYSGIIYKALGFPTPMFTVLFALGRLPGWIAQWKELRERNENIGRPRQIYTGYTQRAFTNIADRK